MIFSKVVVEPKRGTRGKHFFAALYGQIPHSLGGNNIFVSGEFLASTWTNFRGRGIIITMHVCMCARSHMSRSVRAKPPDTYPTEQKG